MSKKLLTKGGSSDREERREEKVDPMLQQLMKMMEAQGVLITKLTQELSDLKKVKEKDKEKDDVEEGLEDDSLDERRIQMEQLERVRVENAAKEKANAKKEKALAAQERLNEQKARELAEAERELYQQKVDEGLISIRNKDLVEEKSKLSKAKYEDLERRRAYDAFRSLSKNIKAFEGDEGEDYAAWWDQVQEVLVAIGEEQSKYLKGDVLFPIKIIIDLIIRYIFINLIFFIFIPSFILHL